MLGGMGGNGRRNYTVEIKLDLLERDRQEKALTILDIAEKTNPKFSRPAVSLLFNGHSQSLNVLKAVAGVLEHPMSRYLGKPKKKAK